MFDPRGASRTSRREMWKLALEVAELLGPVEVRELLRAQTYREVKEGGLLASRQEVKDGAKSKALRGWIPNEGDSDFGLDDG